jgi:hypothetical protein
MLLEGASLAALKDLGIESSAVMDKQSNLSRVLSKGLMRATA